METAKGRRAGLDRLSQLRAHELLELLVRQRRDRVELVAAELMVGGEDTGTDQGFETYPLTFVDGHWALLRPLPPGDHVLEFGGTTCNGLGGVQFMTSAVYELHVEGPGWHDDDEDEDDE